MGCDIHMHVEKRVNDAYQKMTELRFADGPAPFNWRSYGLFGFLAGVRNYSDVPPLSQPRGLPDDVSTSVREESDDWGCDGHSHSWLSVEELASFNYDAAVEDRRVTRKVAANIWDGGCTAEPGCGEMTTFREFLGGAYFNDLGMLVSSGADRIVFWFDN